jgi:molybdopterin-guanine dinucleotide biosynthesis protein A
MIEQPDFIIGTETDTGIDVDGFVLVGGGSRRMGRDKAKLKLNGTTLAERAARVLVESTRSVSAVGGNVSGTPTVPDLVSIPGTERRAAMVGIHSALSHSSTDWTAVLACDLPFVNAGLFRLLITVSENDQGVHDAVVPVQPDGRPQPLAALYRRRCLKAVEGMLTRGELSLQRLLAGLDVYWLKPDEYRNLAPERELFLNVNTPEDFAVAAEAAASGRTSAPGR